MHPQILFCITHTLIDATNLRCETSTDKTMTLEEEDGVPRHRNWKAKGGARSKNVMQMQTRVAQWQLAVKSGSMHSHLPRNQFLSALGHPMMKTTVLDSALELMKILDGCNLLFYFCILLSCHAAFSIKSISWEHLSVRVVNAILSTDELGPNGILVLPNVGFIVCHVQIP